MSACISGAGEFGEHTMTLGNFVCDECGFDDAEGMFAEVERLRALVTTIDATAAAAIEDDGRNAGWAACAAIRRTIAEASA